MEENKINFLYPSLSSTTLSSPNFSSHELELNSFTDYSQRNIALPSQMYPSRNKMKNSFRKRSCSGSNQRSKPYYIPLRHRQRTQSESQENQDNSSMEIELQMEMDFPITGVGTELSHITTNTLQFNKIKHVQLKKSKSCENLSSTNSDRDLKGQRNYSGNSSAATMEFFVNRIEKLNLNLVHD